MNYLKSKKFSSETVASMVSRAPYLLNFSVKRLDNRLGFYQQQLNLSASNVSVFLQGLSQCVLISTQKQIVNMLIERRIANYGWFLFLFPDPEHCSSSTQITV